MFCTKCGTTVSTSDNFCASCGAATMSLPAAYTSNTASQPETVRPPTNPYSPPRKADPKSQSGSILLLVVARVIFAIGFLVLLYLSGIGVIPGSAVLFAILGYILFCELVVARPIKSRITPPINSAQKSLALLPWLLPIGAIALAFLLPYFR